MNNMDNERFWSKVDKDTSSGCWLWTAGKTPLGYGIFQVKTEKCMGWGHWKSVRAHRFAWELTYGLIPEGMNVLHKCDNPPCVRPTHLFLGTQKDNVRDMIHKGRGAV